MFNLSIKALDVSEMVWNKVLFLYKNIVLHESKRNDILWCYIYISLSIFILWYLGTHFSMFKGHSRFSV